MTKISIIMPVFNDSKLINKSLASILSQTLDDYEIICVDDGSTDNTLDILNNYANQYKFIKVLSQENQGPGKARNYGIKYAQGDYIGFLDADDFFISNNALKELYETASKNNANMVSGNIKLVDGNGTYYPFNSLEYYTNYDKILPEEYGIPWSFYKCIYKKEFLIKNHIEFPDLIRGEDPVFLAEILSLVDVIYTVPIDVYAYYYVDGFVKIDTDRKIHDHILHYKIVFDYLKEDRFKETVYKFRKEMTSFIDLMGIDNAEKIIKTIQTVFCDDEEILKHTEEYFYFKFQNNEELSELTNFNTIYNNPRISIIMPNNNFKESINSILNQTLHDFELICYNNYSHSCLNELSQKDSRIIIKDNIVSIEDALNLAKGNYIYFFNPKGKLNTNALEELYKNAIYNNSDIVLSKLAKSYENSRIDYSEPIYNLDEIFKDYNFDKFSFNYKTISGHIFNNALVPWNKLFKKEFLENNSKLKLYNIDEEDIIFNTESILMTNHISFLSEYCYIYRGEKYYNNFFNNKLIEDIDYIETYLKENNYFEELEFEFYKFKINLLSRNLISSNSEEYFKSVQKIFSEIDNNIIGRLPYYLMKKHNWAVYSDNINQYKLKDEIDDDETICFRESHLMQKIYYLKLEKENLKSKKKKLEKRNNDLTNKNKKLNHKNKKLDKLNNELLNSTSWKLTQPLRKLKKLISII